MTLPLEASDGRTSLARSRAGFTLVELLMVTVIVGILSSMALPRFESARRRAHVVRAVSDIDAISLELREYLLFNGELPESLADVGLSGRTDPWGNPYQYLPLAGADPSDVGAARKDRFMVPINSDFDLYSMGPDGESIPPLTAPQSADDVIRANDGGFIGLASEY